jgi:hypothetical protein
MLIVPELLKNFLQFMERNGSLSRLKELATGSYRQPDKSTPQNPIPFLYNSHPRMHLPSGTLSSGFPTKNPVQRRRNKVMILEAMCIFT